MTKLKYYLHKIDIYEYETYDVRIGDREIVICPQSFSPACYLYVILLLQALLGWKKKGKFTLFIVSKLFQEKNTYLKKTYERLELIVLAFIFLTA